MTMPKAHAQRGNNTYKHCIKCVTHNILFIQKVMPLLAGKVNLRSLESANDTKSEQSIFGEIHTNHAFEMP